MNDGPVLDEDAMFAGIDVIGRMNARGLEIGHLNDDVPPELADWYATAMWNGRKVFSDHHTSPEGAVDALARQLLNGGRCAYCGHTVTTGIPSRRDRRRRRWCVWARVGRTWVRGCFDVIPDGQRTGPQPTARGEVPEWPD